MKASLKLVAALAMSVAVVSGISLGPSVPAYAQETKAKGPTVSRAAAKPLKAAQDAMQEDKWDEALAHLKEVEALTDRNPYDTHLMNEMYGYVYVNTGKYVEASGMLEPGLTSGFLEEEELPRRVRALSQLFYQIKNYDKAIEYGNRAIERDPADEDMYTLVSQSYYFKEDFGALQRFTESHVNDLIAREVAPAEQSLQLILDACLKLDDVPCQGRTLERLVTYHPKDEYWQNLLYSIMQAEGHNEKSLLHVYRLMSEVDVLVRPEDYTEMAQLAIEQGSPGEAQLILEKGFQKNMFADKRSRERNQKLLASAKRQAANDLATLAQIGKDAAAAKTGQGDVGVGMAYLGYEQYDKAIEFLSRGLSKGGVRNEADARLLLGIAQYEAGKKAEALESFTAVKGDPKLERVAALWSVRIDQA